MKLQTNQDNPNAKMSDEKCKPTKRFDLTFSGAGFMGCYYFGVVACWRKYVPRERIYRASGSSAGSLIAAYYLMDLPLNDCLGGIIEMTEEFRRRPLGVFDRSNQMVDVLPKFLDSVFPDDAHERVNGRLHVCMTRLKDMKRIIVSEFDSKQDLIDALNCSCFIPIWSGNHVSTYKGVRHIDGGFSDNLPAFDEHTIRICCFSGATDISPYDRIEMVSGSFRNMPLYFNWSNFRRLRKALFPPSPSFIIDLLNRGFHDAKDFILTNDLIQCDNCFNKTDLDDQPVFSKLTPTITPRNQADSNKLPAEKQRDNRSNGTPSPSISFTRDDDDDDDQGYEEERRSPEPPVEKYLATRRGTLQAELSNLLAVPDKFTLVPNPLPSCPPSPNLNRLCAACIQMRQEARIDLLEEEIMREAEKFRVIKPIKQNAIKSKLTSPIRWFRHLGVKNSYDLSAADHRVQVSPGR